MDNAFPCSADRGAAIPFMLTDRHSIASAQRHLNQPQVRTLSYLRPLACVNGAVSSTSTASASENNTAAFTQLNPRFLNNKGLNIHDIITDRKIDFLCLTETWQHQQDVLSLNQATPPGYVYIQKPRSKGHGGGLAVIHPADILVKQLPVLIVTSFECAAFSMAASQSPTFLSLAKSWKGQLLPNSSSTCPTMSSMNPFSLASGHTIAQKLPSSRSPTTSSLLQILATSVF